MFVKVVCDVRSLQQVRLSLFALRRAKRQDLILSQALGASGHEGIQFTDEKSPHKQHPTAPCSVGYGS